MAFDLKITGGTVIDGSGAPGRPADVAVKDGLIVEIGAPSGPAARVIDAAGAIVTPGFVDLHCHYDGQVSWDADLQPSSLHGVTTCLLGNCGVGFAPVRPADHARLVELMEGVEDIPGTALAAGLRWGWERFAGYMDAIDFPHAIDFAVQVPHDALRVFVMGERGAAGEAATDADIAAMAAELRHALEAGAAGFSTGRSDVHRSVKGEATPAAEATARELAGLGAALRGLDHGVLQAVSDFDLEVAVDGAFGDRARFDAEFDVLLRMAEAAGRPLSLSLSQRDLAPTQWRDILARAEAATAAGTEVRLQVAPRGIGVLLGLDATFHPLMGFPSYKRLCHLPLGERVAQLRDPQLRARILGERPEPLAGDGSAIPPLADRLLQRLDQLAFRMFQLGARPDYEQPVSRSLGARARQQGVPPLQAVYDALLEDEGRALIYFPIYNYLEGNLDCVGEMLRHPLALPGLSDGGAHVGTICDASFPTYLLAHWTRDRARDRLPLARAVQMLTGDGARHLGLRDRGLLQVGLRADLNVIDMAALRLLPPHVVHDLPGPAGGRRLLQDAVGYRATVVRGAVVAADGRLTGLRPGRLARLGARSASQS